MNLVCDESVERPVVERLRVDGHAVVYIAELSPGIPDLVVLEQASVRGAPLVTCDKDFGELVYRNGRANHGVILLRLAGLTNHRKSEIVSEAIASHASELNGAFAVVSSGQIRIRRGP